MESLKNKDDRQRGLPGIVFCVNGSNCVAAWGMAGRRRAGHDLKKEKKSFRKREKKFLSAILRILLLVPK